MKTLRVEDFDSWRAAARQAWAAGWHPDDVAWVDRRGGQGVTTLFEHEVTALPMEGRRGLQVDTEFLRLARTVGYHRDGARWDRLYRALWRIGEGERRLLGKQLDPLVREMSLMAKAVGRDIHKMHAFVRFRKTRMAGTEGDVYLAFHRPDHWILRPGSTFFKDRFAAQLWGILTPDESVCWDGQALHFGAGMPASAAPKADAMEELWCAYYANIFNPNRIKTAMMKREMPVRHWATLPETALIKDMLNDAPRRSQEMLKQALSTSQKSKLRAARVRRQMREAGG